MRKLNHSTLGWLICVAALVAAAGLTGPAIAAESADPSSDEPQLSDPERPALQAGRVVHVDPATGRKKAAPSASDRAAARAHLQSMINRSTAGLIETASPTSGVMVNLQGRFRHATVLSLDAERETTAQCVATLPPEGVTLEVEEASDE